MDEMVIYSGQTKHRLKDDGWVEGEKSYNTAIRGHWAFPALQDALFRLHVAQEAQDEEAAKAATKRVKKVRCLFNLWFHTGEA